MQKWTLNLFCLLFFRNSIAGPTYFMDCSKRKRFCDEVTVNVLERAGPVPEEDWDNGRLTAGGKPVAHHPGGGQGFRDGAGTHKADPGTGQQPREEDRAQQRELFRQLLSIMAARALTPAAFPYITA
ncbi:unnamed protein product [Caretta caretta]